MKIKLKLKPCCCGNKRPKIIKGIGLYNITCTNCGGRTFWFETKDRAVKDWNDRVALTNKPNHTKIKEIADAIMKEYLNNFFINRISIMKILKDELK